MADLCTLADVKEFLGLTVSTDDTLLTSLISAESEFIQNYLNRQLGIQQYTEQFSGIGKTRHKLRNYPCTAVTSVTIDGQAIPVTTSSNVAGYMAIEDNIVLFGYAFSNGNYNCIVVYSAGAYPTLDVTRACVELVATKYREKDRLGLASKGLAGETTSYVTAAMPKHVESILKNYKKYVPS